MGSTTILNAITDSHAWHHVFERFPPHLREVQYLPTYVTCHAPLAGGGDPLLFVYQDASETWCYPFLYQPIRDGWHDIESPYGYSGPLSTSDAPAFLAAAHAAFAAWCQQAGVVAELVRLHPLIEQRPWLPSEVEVFAERPAVSLDLQAYAAGAYQFPGEVRRKLRKAAQAGIEVRPLEADTWARFGTLYRQGMAQLGADAFYFFPDAYFQCLWERVPLRAFGAWQGDHLVAAAVCLVSTTTLWGHLSVSPVQVTGAMNALYAAAADWGVAHGFRRLVRGSGRTAEDPHDSLLAFKRSMATDEHVYRMGRRIHHPQVYAELCANWRRDYPHLVERFGRRVLCYREYG